jgi:hypothetical protein
MSALVVSCQSKTYAPHGMLIDVVGMIFMCTHKHQTQSLHVSHMTSAVLSFYIVGNISCSPIVSWKRTQPKDNIFNKLYQCNSGQMMIWQHGIGAPGLFLYCMSGTCLSAAAVLRKGNHGQIGSTSLSANIE